LRFEVQGLRFRTSIQDPKSKSSACPCDDDRNALGSEHLSPWLPTLNSHRQRKVNSCPLPGGRLHPDTPTLFINNTLDNSEPHTGSFHLRIPGTRKKIKSPVLESLFDSFPVVPHKQQRMSGRDQKGSVRHRLT